MHVTVLREIPEDPELCAAWNSLVLRMEHPEVFFTYEWALAASRAFRESLHPLLFLVHESDQLAGVAALAIDRNKPEAALFLTASTADYCDVLSAPENRTAVLTALLQEIKKLGLRDLILANLPSASSTFTDLPQVAKLCGFHMASRAAYACAVIEFGDEQQRKDIVRAVARKEREKRGLKKLAAVGQVQVTHATTPEQIEKSLESIVSTQVLRFLGTDRVSPLVHPERRIFLKELSKLLAQAGWLKVSQLEVNREPIAWNYGFRFGDSWFWYLPTFRTQYEDCSPGLCLLRLLVEEGCEDLSLRWLDLGLGDESYKSRFGNALRQTSYVQLSQSAMHHAANVGRQVLARNAARFPRFEKKLLGARDLTRAIKSRVQEAGLTGTTAYIAKRAMRSLKFQDEVLLFEAPDISTPDNSPVQVVPLSWDLLAKAAIDNAHDMSTQRYLMRCAQRMKQSAVRGLVLVEQAGLPVHYLWVANFGGFHLSEIDHAIESADAAAAMIFDCWTPAGRRGHGYYPAAIRLAAANLQSEGRRAWIFSAAGNVSSLRGILNAGFEYRFSLVRRTRLGHSAVTRRETTSSLPRTQVAETSGLPLN